MSLVNIGRVATGLTPGIRMDSAAQGRVEKAEKNCDPLRRKGVVRNSVGALTTLKLCWRSPEERKRRRRGTSGASLK